MEPEPQGYLLGAGLAERARLLGQSELYEPEARWLLDRLKVRPGWRVIDIGCGPLGMVDLLAAAVGPQGTVVGLERDPRMLAWARSCVAERDLTNVELVQGEANATGLPRESFDLVHERLVLINVPDPERVLVEMIGLARPGGVVAVQEVDWYSWICDPPHPAWERLRRANEIVQRENGQDLSIGRRLWGLLQAAGLVDVGVKAYAHTWRAGDLLQTQLVAFSEIAQERIRARGLLTDGELQETMAQLRVHLNAPTTIVIHPMLFQAWGRKARPPQSRAGQASTLL